MSSPEALFAAVLAARPAQPLVTFYDEARGERSELSARSLGNWVAKTHFLLSDELGLGAGDAGFVDLPAHWISVPALLGCWTAGLEVVTDPARAAVAFVQPATAARAKGAPDVFAVAPDSAAVGFAGITPGRHPRLRDRGPPAAGRLGQRPPTGERRRSCAGRPVANCGRRVGREARDRARPR